MITVPSLAVVGFSTPVNLAREDLKAACTLLSKELEFHLQNQQTQAELTLKFKQEQSDLKDKIGANVLDVDFHQNLSEILVLPFTLKPCL